MAKINRIGMNVETVCTLELSDEEVKALDALVGYGVDSFLKAFYATLGQAYLEPHEDGIRSLFESVRGCRNLTKAADECREFLQLIGGDERRAILNSEREKRRNFSRIA